MKILESQVFELSTQFAHSQAMSDRRIDVHRFLGDATALFGYEIFQRPHVVQPVGELHQYDAHVINHRQQHLPNIFRLLVFARDVADVGDLCEAFDQMRDFFAEVIPDCIGIGKRVFDDVVKQAG